MPFPTRPMTSTGSPARPGMVSSSAPPMFRAKKKRPGMVDAKGNAETAGEVNPMPQNNGRMTGPPMQMGAGKGSMFADGRKGLPQGAPVSTPAYPRVGPGPMRVSGQPQYGMPPSPNYPRQGPGPARAGGQAQGTHPAGVPTATRMMADGGMGDPDPIGGMPDDQDNTPDMDDTQAPPPQGGGGGMVVIKPEAVCYHDDAQNCSGCMHMGTDGTCEVLQMQVSPDGGCTAFEAGAGGGDMSGGLPGAGATANPEGTSAGDQLS